VCRKITQSFSAFNGYCASICSFISLSPGAKQGDEGIFARLRWIWLDAFFDIGNAKYFIGML
jgi:hypothetical protein